MTAVAIAAPRSPKTDTARPVAAAVQPITATLFTTSTAAKKRSGDEMSPSSIRARRDPARAPARSRTLLHETTAVSAPEANAERSTVNTTTAIDWSGLIARPPPPCARS